MGQNLYEVLKSCFNSGTLPLRCTRAVLTLLPKKGDRGLLRNWSPVSLLWTDDKILAKTFANSLKKCMDTVVHCSQTYCVPQHYSGQSVLIRNIIDISKLDLGLSSIDQEKAFNRNGHSYLFKTLDSFGLGKNAFHGLSHCILEPLYC